MQGLAFTHPSNASIRPLRFGTSPAHEPAPSASNKTDEDKLAELKKNQTRQKVLTNAFGVVGMGIVSVAGQEASALIPDTPENTFVLSGGKESDPGWLKLKVSPGDLVSGGIWVLGTLLVLSAYRTIMNWVSQPITLKPPAPPAPPNEANPPQSNEQSAP